MDTAIWWLLALVLLVTVAIMVLVVVGVARGPREPGKFLVAPPRADRIAYLLGDSTSDRPAVTEPREPADE